MHNYMIFGRQLDVHVVEDAHREMFKDGNREWSFIPTQVKQINKKNAEVEGRSAAERKARIDGLLQKEKEKRDRFKELQIDYDFPGFSAIVEVYKKEHVKEEKPKPKKAAAKEEKPAEKKAEKPAEKKQEKPAEKKQEKPAAKKAEKPVEKKQEKVAEKKVEKKEEKKPMAAKVAKKAEPVKAEKGKKEVAKVAKKADIKKNKKK
jgi:hypothetical protein